MFILYTYDVPSDRSKYFRKILRKYLGHEQLSVFYGELTQSKLEKLRGELRKTVISGDKILEIFSENKHNVEVLLWNKSEYKSGVPSLEKDERHKKVSLII